MQKSKFPTQLKKRYKFLILGLLFCALSFTLYVFLFAQDKKIDGSVVVNGDTVEYSTQTKEFTASGNVEVNYQGSRLTCEKLTINTENKNAVAQGNARLEDAKGIIEGDSIKYNFDTKTGTINSAKFIASPYFGKSQKIDKISENEFISENGYFTTCSYDRPHYRMGSAQVDLIRGDKIRTKNDTIYLGVCL